MEPPREIQSEPMNFQKHQLRNMFYKNKGFDGILGQEKGAFFYIKVSLTKTFAKRSPQNIEFDNKLVPTIDAETYQNSMSNLVTEEIIKAIKNHVFPNSKILQIH